MEVNNMNSYDRIYTLLVEAKSGNLIDYISTTPEKVMSGATRAFRKGARRARTTGVGNEGEDKILTVPRTTRGVRRRARRARTKGQMRDAVNAVLAKKKAKI
tara:strand:+ start:1921 stop:2226 length:306 start_codon:yes stop_codon:yes gene_type:complete